MPARPGKPSVHRQSHDALAESLSQHLACSLAGEWFPGFEDKPGFIPLGISCSGRQHVLTSTGRTGGDRDLHPRGGTEVETE